MMAEVGKTKGQTASQTSRAARKRLEEELRATSWYTRSLLEASLDPLVTIGPDGKIMDVNKAAELVTGVSREHLIGSDFSDYFTEPEKAREGYKKVFSEESVTDYPLTIRHSSGRTIDVLYNAAVYRDEAGEVKGVFAAARDITQLKGMEKELRAASFYARSLLEASLDPLVTIGPDGKITDVNKATELVTGVSRERLIGSDFSNYFTEPEKAREGYKKVFSEGSVTDYPLTIRHSSGRTIDVLYNAAVYRDEAGEVKGVFAAARDITERKQAEEALTKQAQIISRQAQEILEISTPVLQVWEGVLVAPLIGMLDSPRTQRFMELLLERIVETNSPVALIDITGVPTIDTQTAQHLIDTISAVRLLGAQVILTGMRPAIAQTLVHLGVDLSGIMTRSSLAAGLIVAMGSLDLQVISKRASGKEA
jgi:PAS domain S-box-containing protein